MYSVYKFSSVPLVSYMHVKYMYMQITLTMHVTCTWLNQTINKVFSSIQLHVFTRNVSEVILTEDIERYSHKHIHVNCTCTCTKQHNQYIHVKQSHVHVHESQMYIN